MAIRDLKNYHEADCFGVPKLVVAFGSALELAPADPEGLDWMVTRFKPGAPLTLGL